MTADGLELAHCLSKATSQASRLEKPRTCNSPIRSPMD